MTNPAILQQGRMRRNIREAQRRRARRRRRVRAGAGVLLLGLLTLLTVMTSRTADPSTSTPAQARGGQAIAATRPATHPGGYGLVPAPPRRRIRLRTIKGLRSGLLFDVHSGQVLWAQDPNRSLPIASLTKMMTALVVSGTDHRGERALITRQAIDFSGSGVGLLPLGKRVSVETLLYGLLLPSGNDAAIALAQQVAGTQNQFVAMMNDKARSMGLRCTHFASVSGIVDRGNYSCAGDLALLAHAVLTSPELGRIVGSRSAILPFPIKGGKLYLYNNNPLLLARYPGADGVKTGYTQAAGPCLVAAARRGRRWYGVVLLHSTNTFAQAERLLGAAFALRG